MLQVGLFFKRQPNDGFIAIASRQDRVTRRVKGDTIHGLRLRAGVDRIWFTKRFVVGRVPDSLSHRNSR